MRRSASVRSGLGSLSTVMYWPGALAGVSGAPATPVPTPALVLLTAWQAAAVACAGVVALATVFVVLRERCCKRHAVRKDRLGNAAVALLDPTDISIAEALESGRRSSAVPCWRVWLFGITMLGALGSLAYTASDILQPQHREWKYIALAASMLASAGSLGYTIWQVRQARRKLAALRSGRVDEHTLGSFGALVFRRALAQRALYGTGANDDARIVQSFLADHEAATARALVQAARTSTLAAHAIPSKDITWCDKTPIATGRHSEVRRVTLRDKGNTVFAAKVLVLEGTSAMKLPKVVEAFKREASLMCQATLETHNTHVIRIEGVCMEMHNPVIVMELATRGSLQMLIAQPQSIETKLRAIHDIAIGMEQLHSCNPPIGHRDLKSANVLVNSDGDCLIADFGLSKTVGTIVSESATASGTAQQHSFGTPQWSSPEFMQHKVDWSDPVQAQAADVWSFGVVIWEILTGEQPWHNYTIVQLVAAAIAGETLPIPLFPECPELCDMIADCWSRIPHERPTFFDLIQRIMRLSSSVSPVQLPPSSLRPLPPCNDKHTTARASASSSASGGNFPAVTRTVSPGTTAQQAGGPTFDVNTGKRLRRSEGAKFDFRTGKPTSLPPFKPTDRVPGLVEEVVNYNIARMSGLRKHITVRIMVIGPPGVGKSSYINTARAVFSGEAWAEDAEGGPGHDTVTEVASSYPLLTDRPDHIRFTDTRGWRGVTDEAVAFFKDLGRREVDGKTTDMLRFEEKAPRKTLVNLVSAFQNVGNMHHVVVFFIDAYHQYFRPERALPPSLTSVFNRRERPDATLSIVVDEIVAIYSAFKDSSHGAFEPVFFITKADRVRQMKPTWSVSELVQDIVTRVNSQKALGRRGSKGRPLAVRPNQFHEIRSCGSRDEYEELVETKQWVEVQRLHALALARVLPRASALIRKQVEK